MPVTMVLGYVLFVVLPFWAVKKYLAITVLTGESPVLYFYCYRNKERGFWYSLLYALLEGVSSEMQIERRDLDGCLYPMPGNPFGNPALILYDDVPGGAGHVRRLARGDTFKKVLKASLSRLQRCECGGARGSASCYGCLRHYRNQFCHDDLNRGMAMRFLSSLF